MGCMKNMKEELILFNKKQLNNWCLVFKRIEVRFWIPTILFIVYALFHFLKHGSMSTFVILASLFTMVVMSIAAVVFINMGAKRAVTKQLSKFKIDLVKNDYWHWDNIALVELKKYKLYHNFVKNKGYNTTGKYDVLYAYINDESEKLKYRGFLNLGILLALFTPVWAEIVKVRLTNVTEEKLVVLIIQMISVFILIGAISVIFKKIFESVVDTESRSLKRIASLIRELSLDKNYVEIERDSL